MPGLAACQARHHVHVPAKGREKHCGSVVRQCSVVHCGWSTSTETASLPNLLARSLTLTHANPLITAAQKGTMTQTQRGERGEETERQMLLDLTRSQSSSRAIFSS